MIKTVSNSNIISHLEVEQLVGRPFLLALAAMKLFKRIILKYVRILVNQHQLSVMICGHVRFYCWGF